MRGGMQNEGGACETYYVADLFLDSEGHFRALDGTYIGGLIQGYIPVLVNENSSASTGVS